jgi:uncharacterized repeat protein (TIGR04052 family)
VGACLALGLIAATALPAHAAQKKTQPVDIRFTALAGDAPAQCGTAIEGLGTTQQSAQLMDLRFFVSDVRLVRRNGRAVRVKLARDNAYRVSRGKDRVTLIDLEDATGACADGTPGTNAAVRGTVPRGKYVGVRWTVGVPFALNHTDTPAAPAPLNTTAMAWSWQSGRLFTKIEFSDPGGDAGSWAAKAFFVHLGSAGCSGNPATGETVSCKAANRAAIRLPRFNPKRQQIALDLQALLAGNDITRNGAGAPGCMSGPTDPECDAVFDAFGIDWHADGSGNGASPSGIKQTAFRAVKR